MLYEPSPAGRICHICGDWKPRAALVKNKRPALGVDAFCLDCAHVRNKAWADAHVEKVRVSRKRWEEDHPGATKAAIKRWSQEHPDKVREIGRRADRNRSPEKSRAKTQLRTARKRDLLATFTQENWIDSLDYFYGSCAYCGRNDAPLAQDHFIPLTAAGTYTADNIVPACKSCNSRKWNLNPVEWTRKQFGERRSDIILARIYAYFDWIKD